MTDEQLQQAAEDLAIRRGFMAADQEWPQQVEIAYNDIKNSIDPDDRDPHVLRVLRPDNLEEVSKTTGVSIEVLEHHMKTQQEKGEPAWYSYVPDAE